MELVCINSADDLSSHYEMIKIFINNNELKYSSHDVDVLLEWYSAFSSNEGITFASKRGINFFGRKSTLSSLFFLLIYQDGELIAFVPLFRFCVNFGADVTDCEVISFCPDSTIFFYNDILLNEKYKTGALETFVQFFKHYNQTNPYILLLNHIPSSSSNYPYLLKQVIELLSFGFKVGVSPVFWRGGLYPWNLSKIKSILETAQTNMGLNDSVRNNIKSVIDKIAASSETMLVFSKNHLSLKASIYAIFNEEKPTEELYVLYNAIESVFQSHPVKYPYLKLPGSIELFEQSLSSSKRYYYRRYRRRFIEHYGSFIKLQGEAIHERDILDFIALHGERWGNRSNILNKLTSSFLVLFLRKLAMNGHLTLFFAVQDSKRIACMCCIDFKERREFLSSGRSLDHSKYRAGKLLIYETITDSINSGFQLFDFGYGDDAYKADFNWSYSTNNVIALFHHLDPKSFQNIFSLYEEIEF